GEIERALAHLPRRGELVIVDAAAGKGYAGLAAATLSARSGRPARGVLVERGARRLQAPRPPPGPPAPPRTPLRPPPAAPRARGAVGPGGAAAGARPPRGGRRAWGPPPPRPRPPRRPPLRRALLHSRRGAARRRAARHSAARRGAARVPRGPLRRRAHAAPRVA